MAKVSRLTPAIVHDRVHQIRNAWEKDRDFEKAHGLEDDLYEDLLEAIAADTCSFVRSCAREALASKQIVFPRVCA